MTATGALIARHVTDLFPTQTSRFDLAQAARRGVISPLRCVRIPPGPGVRTIAKVPLRRGETVGQRRRAELEEVAGMLGVSRLVLLGHRDSGLPGWPDATHRRALAVADPLVLARRVAEIADAEGAGTVVHDDEQGIYGHPDHRATWRIGSTAAELVGATGYAVTIDREHLHVVARDQRADAADADGLAVARRERLDHGVVAVAAFESGDGAASVGCGRPQGVERFVEPFGNVAALARVDWRGLDESAAKLLDESVMSAELRQQMRKQVWPVGFV